MTADGALIRLDGVCHYFREGGRQRQILFDLRSEIRAGEVVIITGPSGSGKTTALTLIGALRSTQEGSLRVLGRELSGAKEATLVQVRRGIGYIFQQHNLLESLTARQNIEMALALQRGLGRSEIKARCSQILEAVGLGDQGDKYPAALSGGQKQRVGIARALAGRPRIVLADEPTASLDRKSGREAVALMQSLAREQGGTVVMVTHDNRILDVADRILHLEDGRLLSFSDAVLANTRHMMQLLASYNRKGELRQKVLGLSPAQFGAVLEEVTREAQRFLQVSDMAQDETFESMLDQALDAFTYKIGEILDADRASIFLLDRERRELWSKVARDAGGKPFEIRLLRGKGIAGAVFESGEPESVADVYADSRFDRSADDETGYRTRTILCVPLFDRKHAPFGVAQLLNRRDGQPFDEHDERRFSELMQSMSVILESWWTMRNQKHRRS